ncbi:MAG: hypothetical protein K2I87_05700, partial [Bacteroidales bacterium]|nr:hypothetical protein [Bacteroidales bacterium]
MKFPSLFENWSITDNTYDEHEEREEITLFQGQPTGTYVYPYIYASDYKQFFPGTVQNIHTYKDKYIVQGIHCQNYSNGFFKTENGQNYAYSHDNTHPIPMSDSGFFQARNSRSTAVPYLLIYDSARLLETPPIPLPEIPDDGEVEEELEYPNSYDFEKPLWGSYLDADWLYEDIFHITDSAQWKDIYQPYEPVLCSYGNRFFFIGNAKYIDNDLIDNPTMTEEIFHHQGVVLAFSMGCPPEKTAFQNVRFLCPDDSVELKLSPDYTGFKFRFEPAYSEDGSITLNADSTRAWVRKEGAFAATLDGSSLGCPNVTVDTVRISLSPYPEPVSALNPDSTVAACAAVGTVLQAVTAPDSTFSYRWFDGDTVSPKTVR